MPHIQVIEILRIYPFNSSVMRYCWQHLQRNPALIFHICCLVLNIKGDLFLVRHISLEVPIPENFQIKIILGECHIDRVLTEPEGGSGGFHINFAWS